jgi:hypothetical protein
MSSLFAKKLDKINLFNCQKHVRNQYRKLAKEFWYVAVDNFLLCRDFASPLISSFFMFRKDMKKADFRLLSLSSARNRTRTCTPLRILVPETSASTNSAIRAIRKRTISDSESAQDKTRTCTPLRAPAPQAGVSTNFTTWAKRVQK